MNPWETGWEPADRPAPNSTRVGTKILTFTTYHLWKNANGEETIQKDNAFYRVSPGAFNTIPTDASLGATSGATSPTDR